ncbi:hypothetical protein B484DRAFT_95837 [Ochromonadaceae sp. CCMP2298]|nr:hypothetical protein B484DRAFT_95837 [Ochromonadaceae sp. CCMP2298]
MSWSPLNESDDAIHKESPLSGTDNSTFNDSSRNDSLDTSAESETTGNFKANVSSSGLNANAPDFSSVKNDLNTCFGEIEASLFTTDHPSPLSDTSSLRQYESYGSPNPNQSPYVGQREERTESKFTSFYRVESPPSEVLVEMHQNMHKPWSSLQIVCSDNLSGEASLLDSPSMLRGHSSPQGGMLGGSSRERGGMGGMQSSMHTSPRPCSYYPISGSGPQDDMYGMAPSHYSYPNTPTMGMGGMPRRQAPMSGMMPGYRSNHDRPSSYGMSGMSLTPTRYSTYKPPLAWYINKTLLPPPGTYSTYKPPIWCKY